MASGGGLLQTVVCQVDVFLMPPEFSRDLRTSLTPSISRRPPPAQGNGVNPKYFGRFT